MVIRPGRLLATLIAQRNRSRDAARFHWPADAIVFLVIVYGKRRRFESVTFGNFDRFFAPRFLEFLHTEVPVDGMLRPSDDIEALRIDW